MSFKSRFHAYRLFGLYTCRSLWPVALFVTVGLFYGTVAADLFFESTRTIRIAAIALGGVFGAFGTPALIGFIHAAKLRRLYGQEVSEAITARFAQLKDGDAVEFTLKDVINSISSSKRSAV